MTSRPWDLLRVQPRLIHHCQVIPTVQCSMLRTTQLARWPKIHTNTAYVNTFRTNTLRSTPVMIATPRRHFSATHQHQAVLVPLASILIQCTFAILPHAIRYYVSDRPIYSRCHEEAVHANNVEALPKTWSTWANKHETIGMSVGKYASLNQQQRFDAAHHLADKHARATVHSAMQPVDKIASDFWIKFTTATHMTWSAFYLYFLTPGIFQPAIFKGLVGWAQHVIDLTISVPSMSMIMYPLLFYSAASYLFCWHKATILQTWNPKEFPKTRFARWMQLNTRPMVQDPKTGLWHSSVPEYMRDHRERDLYLSWFIGVVIPLCFHSPAQLVYFAASITAGHVRATYLEKYATRLASLRQNGWDPLPVIEKMPKRGIISSQAADKVAARTEQPHHGSRAQKRQMGK